MKTGIALVSALMLVSSGSVLAQQADERPGQDRPAQQQPGQQDPTQQRGDQRGQPGEQRDAQPGERARDGAPSARRQEGPITGRTEGQIRSDELVGSEVLDSAGENVGDVDQLLIGDDGRIVALLVNVGGTLGVGGRTVALSWDDASIERDDDSYKVRTTMTEQQLEDAPEFEDDGGLFGGTN